jgi:hypothetical protein
MAERAAGGAAPSGAACAGMFIAAVGSPGERSGHIAAEEWPMRRAIAAALVAPEGLA